MRNHPEICLVNMKSEKGRNYGQDLEQLKVVSAQNRRS